MPSIGPGSAATPLAGRRAVLCLIQLQTSQGSAEPHTCLHAAWQQIMRPQTAPVLQLNASSSSSSSARGRCDS